MRLPAPHDPDRHRQQAPQGLHGALGFEFLYEAKDCVEDNYTEDHAAEGRHPFPGFEGLWKKGEASRNPEQNGKEVENSAAKPLSQWEASDLYQFIGAILKEPAVGFFL